MAEAVEEGVVERPLGRRIVDYPLVTMLIATALFIAASVAGVNISKLLGLHSVRLEGLALEALIDVSLVLAMYKLVIIRLGRRPRDDLPLRGAPSKLSLGLLAGLLIFGAVVGAAALLGVYRIVGPGDSSRLMFALISTAIVPGFMEELLFRGILFRWLEEFGGSWLALILTSALFGLAHILNPNATWFASFAIAVEAGLLLGASYMLTRSLWFPMGLHAAWNFTQGEIFDVPVSGLDVHGLVEAKLSGPVLLTGGNFGLEASLIALVVATAAGAAMLVWAIRKGQLVRPSWTRPALERQDQSLSL